MLFSCDYARLAVLCAALAAPLTACERPPAPTPLLPLGDSAEDTQLDSAASDDTGIGEGEDDTGFGSPTVYLTLPELGGAATNLLLIQVDTLRVDHLAMYGHHRQTLPELSARPWRVVKGLTASSSWTAPSTASLLTGGDVLTHGVLHPVDMADDSNEDPAQVVDPPTGPTFAEHLAELGYDTALFSGNSFLSSVSGLSRGFQTELLDHSSGGSTNSRQLAGHALEWVDARTSDAPFFLMIQPMDAHDPYRPEAQDRGTWINPDTLLFELDGDDRAQAAELEALVWGEDAALQREVGEQLSDIYDEELLGLDRGLAKLLDGLEARGLLEHTLVVFVSDHGEALGDSDNHMLGHGKAYVPETLHVPFMLLHPALEAGQERCLSASMDVLPTALALLGVPQLDVPQGAPLQLGCRRTVTSSLSDADGLSFLSVRDDDRMLRLSCWDQDRVWFDLGMDPKAERPLSEALLDGDDPLRVAMSAWKLGYEGRYGLDSCGP